MTEQDWLPLREIGFDDRACLEVAHIVGVFNYLTRLADGFGLQLDEPTARAGETGVALRRPHGNRVHGGGRRPLPVGRGAIAAAAALLLTSAAVALVRRR